MSNIPAWARAATSTPALRKRFGAAPRTDYMDVESEDDNEAFIGRVRKIGRNRYEWLVWEGKWKPGEPLPEEVTKGRSRVLLSAISKVRLEYGLFHARRDAEREAAAKKAKRAAKKAKRAARTKPKTSAAQVEAA